MKKQFLFIANWKMNLNVDEQIDYASSNYDNFSKLTDKEGYSIVICPSLVSLYPLTKIFKNTKIYVGAQDCSNHNKGAFTGQVSAESLNCIECKYCIIGHSERRKENHETNIEIAEKFTQLINYSISPVLCIGETLNDHENGKTIDVLKKQLDEIENMLKINPTIPKYLPICIAYEPVWAIGTGKIPELDHLETIFAWLFKQTQELSPSIKWKLLYGGSIKSENIVQLKKIQNLDGFLIGGASLDFQEFEKIVKLEK